MTTMSLNYQQSPPNIRAQKCGAIITVASAAAILIGVRLWSDANPGFANAHPTMAIWVVLAIFSAYGMLLAGIFWYWLCRRSEETK